MRQTEHRGRLHRFCTVLKMRYSVGDPAIHAYPITAGTGLHMLDPASEAATLFTGLVRPAAASAGDIEPGDAPPSAGDA